jgi:hypothetical protein
LDEEKQRHSLGVSKKNPPENNHRRKIKNKDIPILYDPTITAISGIAWSMAASGSMRRFCMRFIGQFSEKKIYSEPETLQIDLDDL